MGGLCHHAAEAGMRTGRASMPNERQHNLDRDEHQDGNSQKFGPATFRLAMEGSSPAIV